MALEDRRAEFHKILKAITPNVYFQPPANVQMKYPCVVYEKANIKPVYGDDRPYALTTGYQVSGISRDPDSPITEALAQLPMSRWSRHYTSENLHHDVFTIFF